MEKYFKNYVIALMIIATIGAIGCKSKTCVEKKSSDCICTYEYNPVCGCNNKTYSNPCDAQCNGITTYTQGACK